MPPGSHDSFEQSPEIKIIEEPHVAARLYEQTLKARIIEEGDTSIVRVIIAGPPGPRGAPLAIQDSGTNVEARANLNFSGFTITDDPDNDSTVVSVTPGSGSAYVHLQNSPALVWTINHLLGYRPSVELFDAGSQEFEGHISHPTVNQTVVTLTIPTAGFARLT